MKNQPQQESARVEFRALRKALGMTQAQAAQVLGVTERRICLLETGRIKPRYAELLVLRHLAGFTE